MSGKTKKHCRFQRIICRVSISNGYDTFHEVDWTANHPPETFSFSPCQIGFQSLQYQGFVYYPHPETKQRHFQNVDILEILAPPIAGVGYGDRVELALNPTEILIVNL